MAPAGQTGIFGLAAPGPRELPASTKLSMERATPLLSSAVSKWLRAHGKTVKPKLSESQKADARMCFKLMDADGSGAIDGGELDAAFKLLGLSVTRKEVDAMLAEVDRDGSGEVEYAEFLEIMTMQLTKLSEQQQGEPAAAAPAGGSTGTSAGDAGNGGAAGSATASSRTSNAASMLPFDVVATAYRRKKLMGALEEDDKDFILSVAAAEEEEKQRVEEEAAAAAARRSRRPSALVSQAASGRTSASAGGGSKGGIQRSKSGGKSGSPSSVGSLPASHASFLDSLSKEERRIIDTLSRKLQDAGDVLEDHAQQQRNQQQQQQHQWQASPASWQAAPAGWQGGPAAGAGAHLSALQQAAAAGMPKSQLGLRPASSAATRHEDFKVGYRLGQPTNPAAAAAGQGLQAAGGAAIPGCGTEGLLLGKPLFSSVKR